MKAFLTRKFLVLIASIGLVACNIRDSFQPIPPAYQQWKMGGSSNDDVKKALIECGWPNVYDDFDGKKPVDLNLEAKKELCMVRKGYRWIYGKIFCEQEQHKSLPACQSGAQ